VVLSSLNPIPRLRTGIRIEPAEDGESFQLDDFYRISPSVRIGLLEGLLLLHADGKRDADAVISAATQGEASVEAIRPVLTELYRQLDEHSFLASPRFEAELHAPVRPMVCTGCFPAGADACRDYFTRMFEPGGLPVPGRQLASAGPLLGMLVPHVDYHRGGAVYAAGFREWIERTAADTFLILATSHYAADRFTLSRRHFETPFGIVETDTAAVDLLAERYGARAFGDPLCVILEHSIELEVILLHFLLQKHKPFRVIPLLVGPMAGPDDADEETLPGEHEDIARMVQTLRDYLAEAGGRVGVLISGDLAHLGPAFGDPQTFTADDAEENAAIDHDLLNVLEAASPDDWHETITADDNARRICGYPPLYLFLEACQPQAGHTLAYAQATDPGGEQSVSFAAVAFTP
jgi:MEMO1 family protein